MLVNYLVNPVGSTLLCAKERMVTGPKHPLNPTTILFSLAVAASTLLGRIITCVKALPLFNLMRRGGRIFSLFIGEGKFRLTPACGMDSKSTGYAGRNSRLVVSTYCYPWPDQLGCERFYNEVTPASITRKAS